MIKIVDKRCENCGEFYLDEFDKDVKVCDICGGNLKRIYNIRKYEEYRDEKVQYLRHSKRVK